MLDGYSKHCSLAYRARGSCSKHDIFVVPEALPDDAASSRFQIGIPSTVLASTLLRERREAAPLTTSTTTETSR